MLRTLSIKNIAVIENVSIDFSDGFNILTGETGAGKSIIIDSINLIKGERAQKDSIRAGEDKARVDALFDLTPSQAKEISDILGMDIEDELVVSREISNDGKGSIKVNGTPVTLSMLKEAGEVLVTIHGQHDNTSLLSKKNHIGFLDSYGKDEIKDAKEKYSALHKQYKEVLNKIEELSLNEEDSKRRLELLEYQIEEIDMANLTAGEDEELSSRKAIIENSYKIADGTARAYMSLYEGTDRTKSAYDTISDAIKAIEAITSYDSGIEEAYSALCDAQDSIKENARFLKNYSDNLEFATEELDSIEDRLEEIHTLKIKYGQTIDAILKKRDEMEEERDLISTSDERIKELKLRLDVLCKERQKEAERLTQLRKESSECLCKEVIASLSSLCMPNVSFGADFKETDYRQDGKDDVEFVICTNAGEEPKPLAKIASGGELSRIMLAIKGVLAKTSGKQLLIFDEVDTGVSGLAAQKIAEKLWKTSNFSQVICITHLPQIAAMADYHYLIKKQTIDQRTKTEVTLMAPDDRVKEIARTLGGSVITEAAEENARELIKLANEYKISGGQKNE